ncbi:MAG TPA: VCBS repeat-containing protein [Planctomycetes bacterium]|nr:VCBS repeat-containing protein [Planctomycetota bacterium]
MLPSALLLSIAIPALGPCLQDSQSDSLAPYQPPGEEVTDAVAKQLEGLDPSKTGWPTEVLHNLAKPRLAEFVELIATGQAHELGRHLSPSYRGQTHLRPTELVTVLDRTGLLVRQAARFEHELSPPSELRSFVRDLLAPYASEDLGGHADLHLHAKSKIFTTDPDPSDERVFTTMALVRFDGPTPRGRLLETNMEWRIQWERMEGAAVGIRSIRVELFDEIRSPGPLFQDVTTQVLSEIPRYEEEFLRGSNAYHFRLDRMDGNVYSGQYGVSVGDVNGDGLDDVFVPQHGGLPNRLLLHRADGSVEDITESSGLGILEETQSALILDLDNDGDEDIAMACGPAVVLAYNDGEAHFRLRRRPLAVGGDKIESLAAADWDGDGDLDLYACMYNKKGPLGTVPTPYQDATNGPRNIAWRNDGPDPRPGRIQRWTDVTTQLGFDENNNKFSYAALFEDFDGDGDLDLYVVNDFGRNNLYRNDDGRFHDVATEVGADDMAPGMGVTVADVDNDGDLDMYVTNMWSSAGRRIASQENRFMEGEDEELRSEYLHHARGNTLLLNDGTGRFRDVTESSGAMNAGWSWGSISLDLNNDGLADFYAPNGFLTGPDTEDL